MRFAIALLVVSTFAAPAVNAGVVSGAFDVKVNLLAQPTGICISSSLSQQTNAIVRVTCQGNQFVSIEARPGQAFVGTHGGAYRFALYRFGFSGTRPEQVDGYIGIRGAVDDWIGTGTITGLRVLNLTERDERLELLVSF